LATECQSRNGYNGSILIKNIRKKYYQSIISKKKKKPIIMKTNLQLTILLSTVIMLLGQHSTRLTSEFNDSLTNSKIKPVENEFILRKAVSVGGGAVPLIDSNTKKLRGISDFDANRLASNTALIINGLRLGYATDAATGKEAQKLYDESFTAAFRNARLKIKQDGIVYLDRPISELYNPYKANSTNRQDDYVNLEIPVVLVGNVDFDMEIEFPDGATPVNSKTEYFELALSVVECRRSNAA
jgi:hypothetical protein